MKRAIHLFTDCLLIYVLEFELSIIYNKYLIRQFFQKFNHNSCEWMLLLKEDLLHILSWIILEAAANGRILFLVKLKII